MKVSRQTRRQIARLFRACTVNGLLDESRVRYAVHQMATYKRRDWLPILALLRRLVQIDIARRTAKVESAFRLPPNIQAEVKKNLADTYGAGLNTSFCENPGLIAGMRIKVGSDVYDGTVENRLNAIEQSFT